MNLSFDELLVVQRAIVGRQIDLYVLQDSANPDVRKEATRQVEHLHSALDKVDQALKDERYELERLPFS